MRAKTEALEAKEQKANEQREFAGYFSLLAKKKGFESAWRAYKGADSGLQSLFREFRSDNGILDFPTYLQEMQNSRPCGMADKIEKMQLIDEINAELRALPGEERKSYLNGKLLTLEL